MGFLLLVFLDFKGGLDFLIDLEILFMYIIKFTILPVISEMAMGEAFLIIIVLMIHNFPMKFGEGGIPAAFMITRLSSDWRVCFEYFFVFVDFSIIFIIGTSLEKYVLDIIMVALFLSAVLAISQVLLNIDELIITSLLVFLFICVLIGIRADATTNASTAFILIVVIMMRGGIFCTVASMRNSFHVISLLMFMYHECSGGTPIFIMEAAMIIMYLSLVCVFSFSVLTAVIRITADPAN